MVVSVVGSVGCAKGAKVGGEVGDGVVVHLSHVTGQASLTLGRSSQKFDNCEQGNVTEPINIKLAESWHDPSVVGEGLGDSVGEMVGEVDVGGF